MKSGAIILVSKTRSGWRCCGTMRYWIARKTRARACRGLSQGCIVLTRTEATVRLDIDAGCPRPRLAVLSGLCRRAGYAIVALSERQSPGGKGWHLTLELEPRPRTMVEVVALQAICGSDPWREAVTLYRSREAWDAESRRMANVLYSRKLARGKLFGKGATLRMDVVAQEAR